MVFETLVMRLFAFIALPPLYRAKPVVEGVSSDGCKVTLKLPMNRSNRNHVKSMYFGAAMMGAEAAAGYLFVSSLLRKGQVRKVGYVVANVGASFLKPPRSAVRFTATLPRPADYYIQKCIESGENMFIPVHVVGIDDKRKCYEFEFSFCLQPPRE